MESKDHVAVTGDWMFSSPIPRSFFSPMMNDDMVVGSLGESLLGNRDHPLFPASELGEIASGVTGEKEATTADIKGDGNESYTHLESKVGSGGNLVERMTARSGYKAPRLNAESIRSPDIPVNSDGQQPFLMTIPPGLSPTALLDSPVFLNNSQIMPSPTTGKLSFAPCGNSEISASTTDRLQELSFQDSLPFMFNPITEPRSYGLQFLPGAVSLRADDSNFQQNLVPVNFQSYANSPGKEFSVSCTQDTICHSVSVTESSQVFDDPSENTDQSSGDSTGSPADDGYSWRKYGQKQVKGSEYPRSYYKCTSANCPVKKKVERSHEGHITEIIYTGAHNHSKSSSDARGLISSSAHGDMHHLQSDSQGEGVNNSDHVWLSVKQQWSKENHEAASSVRMSQEYSNGGGVDGSSNFSNDEDGEHHAHDSIACDDEEDESDSKRRRHETHTPEMHGASRAVREPRVVVQTTSEVDILDDGYRWRKYGQKVVKGNPNPRSYYKCTSPGCNVRKHVERASHDLKSVITTYEGKHNHDVPVAKNSSHVNSGNSNPHLSQQPPPMLAPGHIHRSEPPQMLSNMTHFVRPELGGSVYGFGMNQPSIPNLGFMPNHGRLPVLPLHQYSGHQSQPVTLMMPKLEPLTTDSSGLGSCDGSSLYQQYMR